MGRAIRSLATRFSSLAQPNLATNTKTNNARLTQRQRAAVLVVRLMASCGFAFHYAGGDEIVAALFERDARKRTRRWAGEHRTIGNRVHAAVAGTHDLIFFGTVEDRTRGVRADAAVSEVGVFRRPQEDARIYVRGISENFRAADGNFSRLRDYASGKVFRAAAQNNPGGGCGGEAAEREKFVEAAAREFLFAVFVGCFSSAMCRRMCHWRSKFTDPARLPTWRRVCKTRTMSSSPTIPTMWPSAITGIWLMLLLRMR